MKQENLREERERLDDITINLVSKILGKTKEDIQKDIKANLILTENSIQETNKIIEKFIILTSRKGKERFDSIAIDLIGKILGKTQEEVKKDIKSNFVSAENLLIEKGKIMNKIVNCLIARSNLEDKEDDENFHKIEQKVISKLPKVAKDRISEMHNSLSKIRKRHETDVIRAREQEALYRKAIMKLYNKEVIITSDSVKFMYAHKELFNEELQLPDGKDIQDEVFEGLGSANIKRKTISSYTLDKKHPSYNIVQNALKKATSENKHFATKESVFSPILEGLEGEELDKLSILRWLIGDIGTAIISKKKKDNKHEYLLTIGGGILFITEENGSGAILLYRNC